MKTETWRFIEKVAIIDLCIFVRVPIVCLLGGYPTAHQYGSGLTWAGFIAIGLGTLVNKLSSRERAEHYIEYKVRRMRDNILLFTVFL